MIGCIKNNKKDSGSDLRNVIRHICHLSPRSSVEKEKIMNIGEWTTQWAELYPNETCIIYQDLELTKKKFNQRVNQTANAFLELGVKKGDRVGVLMANSNVYLEILFAMAKIGGIMVALNSRLAPDELDYIINDAEPKVMAYSPEFVQTIETLRDRLPSVKHYFCEMEGGAENDRLFESWIADKSDQEPDCEEKVVIEDPLFIMYTSGTSGLPKGAVITQQNVLFNVINIVLNVSLTKQDINVACAPLFHVSALTISAMPPIYTGGLLVIQRAFDPSAFLKLVETHKVTWTMGVPVMWQFAAAMPEFKTADISSLRFLVSGGSLTPRALIETYGKRGIQMITGFGMTETAGAATSQRPEAINQGIGSSGKAHLHTLIRIIDMEGKPVKRGEIGEILMKGPNIMKEYWRRPEATAETIVDGWLYSGDIGYLDEDGFLYIQDRKKDMYKSGGENVYPAQVEDVIHSLEGVSDVAVIGIPDEQWQEVGMAIVVKKPEADLSEDGVIAHCRENLASYKCPKKVEFVDQLPRTITGKLLKKDLKKQYGKA